MWMFVAAAIHGLAPALEYEIFDEPPVRVFDLPPCGAAPSSGTVEEDSFSWDTGRLRCKQVRVMRGLLPKFAACHAAALAANPDIMPLDPVTISLSVGIEAGRAKHISWYGPYVEPDMYWCIKAAVRGAHFPGRDGDVNYTIKLHEP